VREAWKLGIILGLVCLIAASALGIIYMISKRSMEKADLSAKLKAIRVVLLNTKTGDLLIDRENIPKTPGELKAKIWKEDKSGIVYKDKAKNAKIISPVYEFKATNGNEIFVVQFSGVGFGGSVVVIGSFIYDGKEITENAVEIVDYSQETPGLGAKIAEKKVEERFFGINSDVVSKYGLKVNKDARVQPQKTMKGIEDLKKRGIIQTSDIMTGATITPRGVTNALQATFEWLKSQLKGSE